MAVDRNEKGFTLLESLIVLLIAITMSSVVYQYGHKMMQDRAEQEAIDLLVATLYDMQSYAIGHAEYVILDFFDGSDGRMHYVVRSSDEQELVRRALPEGMTVTHGDNLKILGYHRNGRLIYLGSLLIKIKDRRVRLALQMQYGRVIVYEE